MTIPDWAEEVLTIFENQVEPHQEVEIAESLSAAARRATRDQTDKDWKGFIAEWSAFLFDGKRHKESIWGTYFSPMMSVKQPGEPEFYSPDIKNLDAESVAHWETRARYCPNPMMRARYSDVAWDLKRAITAEKPNPDFARIAINSYLEAVEKKFYPMEMFGIDWIGRALDLALSINDTERVRRVVDSMFELYNRVAQPRFPGTWLFLFDNLYEVKGVGVEQEIRIIADLEAMFAKVTDTNASAEGVYDTLDPWAAEAAAQRLAQYYRTKDDKVGVDRVIRAYGKAFEHMAREANPMMAVAWLEPVIERYEQEGLREDAEKLQNLAAEKGKNIKSDLKTISVEANIKQEDVEKLVEHLLGGNLKTSLATIADYFIPKVDDVRSLLERLRTDAPFLSLVPIKVVETCGSTTAVIGSLDDDFEGRLNQQLGRTIGFYQPFLEYTLIKFRNRYAPTVDVILDFLCESPLFAESRDGLLRDGLLAFLQDDFVKAVHVLVPQVEHTLRHFLGMLGIPIRKTVRNRPGITDAKNMNDVLADARVRDKLTENLWRYLSVVYVDRRGLNLRNDLAHGLVPREGFKNHVADRVFHTLLAISLLRAPRKASGGV